MKPAWNTHTRTALRLVLYHSGNFQQQAYRTKYDKVQFLDHNGSHYIITVRNGS